MRYDIKKKNFFNIFKVVEFLKLQRKKCKQRLIHSPPTANGVQKLSIFSLI